MTLRSRSIVAVAAAASILLLAGCSGPTAPAHNSATSSAGGKANASLTLGLVQGQDFIHAMPARVAEAQGYFTDEGLTVNIVAFTSGSDLTKAMAGGTVNVGAATGLDAVAASAHGVDLKAFWGVEAKSPMVLVSKAGSSISKFSDLAGKNVGISAAGSLTDYTLRAALKASNVDFAKVHEVPLGAPSSTLAALTRGDIDAYILPANFGYVSEADGSGKAGQSAASAGGHDQFAILMASSDYLSKNKTALSALTRTYTKAIEWMKANRTQAIALAVSKLGMKEDIAGKTYDRLMPQFTADGALDAAGLAAYAKALPELGIATAVPEKSAYLDSSFSK